MEAVRHVVIGALGSALAVSSSACGNDASSPHDAGGGSTTGGSAAAGTAAVSMAGQTVSGSSSGGAAGAGQTPTTAGSNSSGTGGSDVAGSGGSANAAGAAGSGGMAPAGLSFVPAEGITSVALSVNPDGVLLPMKLHNGDASSASVTALGITMGDAFKLETPPSVPLDIAAGQDLLVNVRFAPTTTSTATFEAKLTATSAAGTPSAPLFGLAMNKQNGEATLSQVVQTLGYKVNVGGTGITLGTGSGPIGDEVVATRFVKAGAAAVGFQVVARYSPFEAAAYGYYTGAAPNVMRTQLGIMSKGAADNIANRTLFPPLDAGALSSFDPGSEPFGFFAESQSNAASLGADARFFQEESLNDDQGGVLPVHRFRVYPLKDRSGTAIVNSYLIGCEEASNSDYQDYVFVVSGVSIAK
jgi:hypothetical protein